MPIIGSYSVYTIETGHFRLDGGAMFGVVPKTLWERRMAADANNRIDLAMRCLLLEGNGRLILVDNGIGHKYDSRIRDMWAINHSEHTLAASLRANGFGVEDITDIILTHLHFDHGGGSTVRLGDRLQPTFPNAVYHVQREHLEWARNPNEREKASFLASNIEPVTATGQWSEIDGPGTLFPGIDLLVVHGHTRAQQLVKVSGPEGILVYVGDLLPTTHHLRGPWLTAYDVEPLVSLKEKAAFLKDALHEDWRLFFEHDPEVVIADIAFGERGIAAVHARPLEELF